jgi:hypothetical protein
MLPTSEWGSKHLQTNTNTARVSIWTAMTNGGHSRDRWQGGIVEAVRVATELQRLFGTNTKDGSEMMTADVGSS